MRVLLDTNRYRDLAEGDKEVLATLRRCAAVCVSFVTLGELRAGFALGRRTAENEKNLSIFLARPSVRTLWPDEQTTHHYARLYRQLKAQGTPIPTNDIWIAALVAQHDLLLYSRDGHFDRIPQLARVG